MPQTFDECADQPADGWGEHGPNQAIDEADCKIHLKNSLWKKKRVFSGCTDELGNIEPINEA
jgi:hypothetical protein